MNVPLPEIVPVYNVALPPEPTEIVGVPLIKISLPVDVAPCNKLLPASITIAAADVLVADRLLAIVILPVVVSISILTVAKPE